MAATRKPSLLLAIALCVALAASGCSAIIEAQTHNAFDEMYLSVKHPSREGPSFWRMEPIQHGGLIEDTWIDGHYFGGYDKSLRQGEDIVIYVHIDDNLIIMSGTKEIADTRCMSFGYTYDFPRKTLTIRPVLLMTRAYAEMGVEFDIDDGGQLAAYFEEHGITRDDVERCCDYFLYDKVLTDWVMGNGARSSFSPGDFGDFTVIDDTFANLGEDWR
jgi:hypothetical protein